MAASLVVFCLIANWPFWPRSRFNILLNFTFEREAKRANLQGHTHKNSRNCCVKPAAHSSMRARVSRSLIIFVVYKQYCFVLFRIVPQLDFIFTGLSR